MKSNKNVDWFRSKNISDSINGQLGECLANAVRAFIDYPEILPTDAVLVEGIYYHGGQPHLHTWIETSNSIIELSLVHDKSRDLYGPLDYYPIQPRSQSEIISLYGNESHEPGARLMMKLNFDDPRVDKLINIIETHPGLKQ